MYSPRRTLVESFPLRAAVLVLLYVGQGAPFGFTAIFFLSYLTDLGMADSHVALLTTLLLLPWSWKFVLALPVDRFARMRWGRRRPWILAAQSGMAVTLLMLIGAGPRDVAWLGGLLLVHNLFAALQDVAADGLAIDVLSARELGRVNGWMWCGRLAGKSAGAVVSVSLATIGGLPLAVAAQLGFSLLVIGVLLMIRERPEDRWFPWSGDSLSDKAAIEKTPHNNYSSEQVPWHQDGPYWPLSPCRVITAWVNLGQCTAANGALRVIPGSHLSSVSHRPTEGEHPNFDREIDSATIADTDAVQIEMQPGEVLFFTESLVHASGPNASDVPRLAFTPRYCPATSKFSPPPGDTRRLFIVRGTAQETNEQYLGRPPVTGKESTP